VSGVAFSNRSKNYSTPLPISASTLSSAPAPPRASSITFRPGTDSAFLGICRTGDKRFPSITMTTFRPDEVKVRGMGGEPSPSPSAGGLYASVPGVLDLLG